MAIVNPSQSKGRAGAGSRLRNVREEEQEGAVAQRPSAMPGSPLRQLIRGTMLTGLSRGVAPTLRMRPEPEVAAPSLPPQAMGVGMGAGAPPGMVGGAQRPEMTLAQPPAFMGGGNANVSPGGGQPSAPQGAPQAQGAPAYTSRGQVQGRSTSNQPGSSRVGASHLRADPTTPTPVTYMNRLTKQDPGFEEAQTPMQNILGGLGMHGTNITSALGLPQLMPGGFFADLQRRMGPSRKENTWFPNWGA